MEELFYLFVFGVVPVMVLLRWWKEDRKIRFRTEIPCSGPPEQILSTVARHLDALGYQLTDAHGARSMFRYAHGQLLAGHRADRSHFVRAIVTGASVVLEVLGLHGKLRGEDRDLFAQRLGGVGYALRPAPHMHLPAQAHAPQQPTRERMIERQVLVARCRWCSHVTPVDLERCKNCGAAKFV